MPMNEKVLSRIDRRGMHIKACISIDLNKTLMRNPMLWYGKIEI
jgi:hypothetical protein